MGPAMSVAETENHREPQRITENHRESVIYQNLSSTYIYIHLDLLNALLYCCHIEVLIHRVHHFTQRSFQIVQTSGTFSFHSS